VVYKKKTNTINNLYSYLYVVYKQCLQQKKERDQVEAALAAAHARKAKAAVQKAVQVEVHAREAAQAREAKAAAQAAVQVHVNLGLVMDL
jgi:hypothetical protein